MQPTEYLKQRCAHCSNNVEFPASGIGEFIHCPHCGLQIHLESVGRKNVRKLKEQLGQRSLSRIIPLAVVGFIVLALCGSYLWRLHSNRAELLRAKNQIRTEAMGLALDIEKGVSSAVFEQKARHILLLFRLHSNDLPQDEVILIKQIESSIDMCSYFWSRVNTSGNEGKCIPATATDKTWLAKAGLSDQEATWRAYDFKAESQRITDQLPAMLEFYLGFAGSTATGRLNAEEIARKRISEALLKLQQQAPELLNNAARRRDHFNGEFALESNLGRTRKLIDELAAKMASELKN